MKTDIHTIEAKTAGSIELAEHIFGLEPRADILHRVDPVAAEQAPAGHASGQVARRNQPHDRRSSDARRVRRPARHGSRKAGIFVGGGKAFGPRFRSHETVAEQEGPRAWPAPCAVEQGQGLVADHPRQGRGCRRQDQDPGQGLREARPRQCADHRRRRGERGLRHAPPAAFRTSTCCRSRASMSTTSCAARSWC